jgi:hypothetical protein
MADQYRHHEDHRRGGRRDWTANDEGHWNPERYGAPPREPRGWRSQGDGDRYSDDGYTFSDQPAGYGRGTDFGGRGSEFGGREPFGGPERGRGWQDPDPWQSGSRSFGGQRGYARDLYSDSAANRHETDWESGSAGRGMRGVYSRPSFVRNDGSGFGRYQDESHWQPRRGFAGRGPKDYQRSDERIREEISDRMTDDDSLDASDITIQVKGGEVTLTGTVSCRDDKRRAEDLAEGISGVREITNNIRVSREPNGMDLNQSPSIEVTRSGQAGSTPASRNRGAGT